MPKGIISDRGSAFSCKMLANFVQNYDIKHTLVATAMPQANGQVERVNKIIVPMIAKLTENISKWDDVLLDVEYAVNNSISRAIKETPSKLLVGIEQIGKNSDALKKLFMQN